MSYAIRLGDSMIFWNGAEWLAYAYRAKFQYRPDDTAKSISKEMKNVPIHVVNPLGDVVFRALNGEEYVFVKNEPPPPKVKRRGTSPDYYCTVLPDGTDIDCIDVINVLGFNFNRGCALKYLWRAGKKPGSPDLVDLEKAKTCIEREIARVKGQR